VEREESMLLVCVATLVPNQPGCYLRLYGFVLAVSVWNRTCQLVVYTDKEGYSCEGYTTQDNYHRGNTAKKIMRGYHSAHGSAAMVSE